MGAALRVSLNSCFLEVLCNRVRSRSLTDSIVTDQLRLFDKVIVRQGLRCWRKLSRKFWIVGWARNLDNIFKILWLSASRGTNPPSSDTQRGYLRNGSLQAFIWVFVDLVSLQHLQLLVRIWLGRHRSSALCRVNHWDTKWQICTHLVNVHGRRVN